MSEWHSKDRLLFSPPLFCFFPRFTNEKHSSVQVLYVGRQIFSGQNCGPHKCGDNDVVATVLKTQERKIFCSKCRRERDGKGIMVVRKYAKFKS